VSKQRTGLSTVKTLLIVLVTLGVLVSVTGSVVAAAAYSYYTQDLPSPDKLQDRQAFSSTKILDRNGNLLYEVFDPQAGKRTSVKLAEMSPYLRQATIAIEDDTFYDNPGFSPRGIARAAWAIARGEDIQGGSTITQQLIKRVLLGDEVTIDRKIREVILAYRVNQQYTKDQILEWYINEIYYGNMSYGIEAAAESYFGKRADQLDLAESAMLAGIPQAPALLSPLVDPAAARRRQGLVLDAMVQQGYISQNQSDAAAAEPLDFQPMKYGIEAPHFVMYVRDLLEQKYGPQLLYSGGLTVRTSIDLDMQHVAERITRQQVQKLASSNIHNASLVAIKPETGEIMAMVGSVDYFDRTISGQVNMATADRQPGSTFKPITYSAAFMKGWSPSTVILDDYTIFHDQQGRPYTPKNVDNQWHGPVTVRKAIGNSMNVPAVKTLEFVGVKDAVALAHKMGITTLQNDQDYGLSLTLGGGEVKLLDLTYAYSVFANGGVMNGEPVPSEAQKPGYRTVEPVAILSVEDANGKILEEYKGPEHSQVLSPQIAFLMNSILTDNDARMPLFAPNNPLKLSRPAGAKTGTTENNRDLWTMGYTPDLVTGVWVGNSDNQEIAQVLGSMAAGPIMHDFMEEVLAGTPVKNFDPPGGLEKAEVCAVDGLLPNQACPTKITDWFIKGTVPTKVSNIYQQVTVDKSTGQLATASTKPEDREQKVVAVYPPEWQSWAKAAGKLEDVPQAPQPTAAPAPPVANNQGNSTLLISSPATGATVRDVVEIRGTASGKGFASYKVEYGEGLTPSTWKPIGVLHAAPTDNGVLERWDTKGLSGLYKIRVTLTEQQVPSPTSTPGPVPTARPGQPPLPPTPVPTAVAPKPKVLELPVMVDNTPPVVSITYPADNAEIKKDQMERITFTAQVSDNLRLAQTGFYVDDKLVGTSTASPASYEWVVSAGSHVIRAQAKDAAGNETRSADVKIVVK
jgi:1A family penicillin-binding protein